MTGSLDSSPLVALVLLVCVVAIFVAGIISSVRLLRALEYEDTKNKS
jgi:hypothetical protein